MSAPTSSRDYYLIKRPPRRSQYRNPRRNRFTGCQVIHSAENAPDIRLPDTGGENTASFIRNRTTAGSYHSLSDSDSIIWMVPLWYEAYHDGTGSNRWSIGHSVATQAAKWKSMPDWWRDAAVTNVALAAASSTIWLKNNGYPITPAKRISKSESTRGLPGFISHGERDPGRRSDPGADFPWDFFLRTYAFYCQQAGIDVGGAPAIPSVAQRTLKLTSPWMRGADVVALQKAIGAGADGVFGPGTDKAVRAWQLANGLRADGIVGGDTWTKILNLEPVAPVVPPLPPQASNPQETAVSDALKDEVRDKIYPTFGGRPGEKAGVDWWASQIAGGKMSKEEVGFTILQAEGLPLIWKTLTQVVKELTALKESVKEPAAPSGTSPEVLARIAELERTIASLSATTGTSKEDILDEIVHRLSKS